jgi:hypothetical protein
LLPTKLAIIIGHSHIGALTHALARRDTSVSDERAPLHVGLYEAWKYNGEPPYLTKAPDGTDHFNPAILASVAGLEAGRSEASFFTLFGGNGHSVVALVRHPRPFDFVLPEAPDLPLDPDAELVPVRYVGSILQGLLDPFLYQLYCLRKATQSPVLAFEAPPVNGDADYLSPRLDAFFTQGGGDRMIGAKHMRLKTRLLQTQLQARICTENGIELIPPPAASLDPEGFMVPECYGSDATHAGEFYGELLLHQIEARMDAQIRSWSTFS